MTMKDTEMRDHSVNNPDLTSSPGPLNLQHLKEISSLIESGSYNKEVRQIVRALRLTVASRRKLTAPLLVTFFDLVLVPGSEAHSRLSHYIPKAYEEIRRESFFAKRENEQDMEEDTASSAGHVPQKHLLPEIEIYCYLLLILFLIDKKKLSEAKECSFASISRLKNLNRRTVDVLASKIYFYYSYCYELTGNLVEIRGHLLSLHRAATLRRDELGQEMLVNLLLRNYLHYNLYDQAEKLRSKAPQFEARSNHQFCRYLFYLGKIRTIQLEYTDAKESLLQAARKAPASARAFRIECNKWAVIVRLLLGEIPERTVFMQKGMELALKPYFELTNAVRRGDLEKFERVAGGFWEGFRREGTGNLIVRLRRNVIRTGLRNITMAYSRISLEEVGEKVGGMSGEAEGVVAKAIRDGAIEAAIDHTNGWMVSKETGDLYSTTLPLSAFHSRISFCLNTHNDAVRALRFPPNPPREKDTAQKRRERHHQEQELAKHIAEEEDDDF